MPTRYDFFIAHAAADKPAARSLDDQLRAQGSTAFLDERCVTPGTPWDAAIPAALEASRVVVALVSGARPAPGGGHYFRDELASAIDRHRNGGAPVVPIYLEGQSPPAAVPYGLRILHGLFVEGPGGWDDVVARLLSLVRAEPPKDVVELKKELADLEAEVARDEAGWTTERRAERRALTRKLREATEPTDIVKPGACFAGRYPIVEKLGQGAFASVWKALDGRRTIALRIMHPHLGSLGRERFFRGSRAMAALDHPSVVRVYEAEGEYQGQAFLTMELLAGGDLAVARKSGRVTREDTARIITAVASALETAHERGLIHRDVKPTNIVLSSDGVPKLTDFDLVHAADSYAGTQAAVGSPCFMAPECDGRVEPTEAADQFGLAMTAVWLLAERDLLIGDWMRPERTLARLGLPDGAVQVLLKALEIDPRERHPSIRGFAEALAEALSGVAGRAGIESRPETGVPTGSPAFQPPAVGGTLVKSGLVGSLPGLVMVPIPGGTFMMGSPSGVGGADEQPQHQVTLPPFFMSATPITQAQYRAVTSRNPSHFKGEDRPVEQVSWEEAVDFCNALSRREGLQPAYDAQRTLLPNSTGYRLPTEEQWEYACRAGNPGRWCFGDDEEKLSEYAWFGEGSSGETHPVALKTPNAWGLYDMHGNVWEWCCDWYGTHPDVPQMEPPGAPRGHRRVIRGGSVWGGADGCRSAFRSSNPPDFRFGPLGFRVVCPRQDEALAKERRDADLERARLKTEIDEAEARLQTTRWALSAEQEKLRAAQRVVPPPPPTLPRVVQPGEVVAPATTFRPALRYAPPGTFMMGSPPDEPGRFVDEIQHPVTLTRPLWVMETPVTRAHWKTLLGSDPSYFKRDPRLPAESVNWFEAVAFANALSEKEGLPPAYEVAGPTGTLGGGLGPGEGWGEGDFQFSRVRLGPQPTGYRLPTEAEWEYLARAGTQGAIYAGSFQILGEYNAPALDPIAWYGGNSGTEHAEGIGSNWREMQKAAAHSATQPVGRKVANPWGLHDMLGNVWEWCEDWYAPYPPKSVSDPLGPPTGVLRVNRGGFWGAVPRWVRVAFRSNVDPTGRHRGSGFRLVRAPSS